MAWVQTTDKVHVRGKDVDHPEGTFSIEEAQRSASERNKRAEKMGLKTRYEAVGLEKA